MVKVGDIVRFLNAVGGGIVTEIKGTVAMVEDADGFEIPVSVQECVVVAGADVDGGDEGTDAVNGDMMNVSLAYVRTDEGYDVLAVNIGSYTVYMQVLVKSADGKWKVKFAGDVMAGERRQVFVLKKGEMSGLCRKYLVRLLPYKPVGEFGLKPFYEVSPSFDPKVFSNDALYKDIFSLGVRALEVPLVYGDDICDYDVDFDVRKVAKENGDVKARASKRVMWPVEEDLHAETILDTVAGMGPRDILQYQKEYARGVMKRYYGKVRGGEVIFIHGKGDGVLKKELRRILREEFPKCRVSDASFAKYGTGATRVEF